MSSQPKEVNSAEELAKNSRRDGSWDGIRPIELSALGTDPLVSIAIANYNYGRYLGEAVESVLRQSYQNFEVIVCDDGSSDDSRAVIARYCDADDRVKLIAKANGGMASALNAAFAQCAGEIICLLDADDRWLPNKLSAAVDEFLSHPQAGFLSHRLHVIDSEGRRRGVTPIIANPPSGWFGSYALNCAALPAGLSPCSGLSLRREVAERIFPIAESFRANADGVILHLAPLMTPIIGVPRLLGEYRVHGRNLTIVRAARIDANAVEADMELGRTFWKEQHDYVAGLGPAVSDRFPDYDNSLTGLLATYTLAKIRGDRSAKAAYRGLVSSSAFRSMTAPLRFFWRISIVFPRPIFRAALQAYKSQGPTKRCASRLSEYMRSRKRNHTAQSSLNESPASQRHSPSQNLMTP